MTFTYRRRRRDWSELSEHERGILGHAMDFGPPGGIVYFGEDAPLSDARILAHEGYLAESRIPNMPRVAYSFTITKKGEEALKK